MKARLSPDKDGTKVFSRHSYNDYNLIDFSEERAYYFQEFGLPLPYSFEGMRPY